MKKLITILLFITAAALHAQTPWSTFLDPSRAIDWTSAGFTVPNYSVNCSTQPTLLTGAGNAAANATSIQTALASCDATHNVVNIPAGTYSVQSWQFPAKGFQVVRGAGANSTFLLSTTDGGYGGLNGSVGMISTSWTYSGAANVQPGGSNACTWATGYTQGSTTLTFTSCGSAPPLNKMIILDQGNDTSDNGGAYVCNENTAASCNYDGTGAAYGRLISGISHSQEQVTFVTGVTNTGGSNYTVTISPGVYFSNIRSGASPGAWWSDLTANNGIENLSLTPATTGNYTVIMFDCYHCWVKGVSLPNGGRASVTMYQSMGDVIRDSYFYGAQNHASVSYNIESQNSSAYLVENNIMQQTTTPMTVNNGTGGVIDYNFAVDSTTFAGYSGPIFSSHDSANSFNLWEGNAVMGFMADNAWGSPTQQTYFRNSIPGWSKNGSAGNNNTSISLRSYARAFNFIGNVMGQPSYSTAYIAHATSTTAYSGNANASIYDFGAGVAANTCGTGTPQTSPLCDTLVQSTAMLWGNYDTVNAAVRWNSTEAAPAAVTYVAANFTTTYFNTLAQTLPASLFYSSTPSWWTSGKNWPAVGPDVTTGNVGICTGTFAGAQATTAGQCSGGTKSAAWASHVTSIPAQDCFLNTMGGPPDGSGSVLTFSASTCFAITTVATPTASPVAGTYHGAQTITLSTTTGGATICYTVDGTTPTANGAGTCTHGTTYSGTFVVDLSLTVQAIGSLSGDTDSSVLSAAYTITHTTWYIRPDGGTKTQCTGLVNAAYPGSGGPGLPCALAHPYWMMNNVPAWTSFIGGDTMQFINTTGTSDTYFTGEQNAGVGIDWNANGLTVPCAPPNPGQANGASCVMPQVPSGTVNAHTKMYGQSVGACHDSGHTHLVNPTILSGIAGAFSIINLRGASYVDVSCFGLTQPDTCTTVGNGTGKCGNLSNFVHFGGIVLNYLTGPGPSNITVTDIAAVGIGSQGILGSNMSGTNIFTDVYVNGNGGAGWSGDGGGCGTSCESTGVLNLSHNIYAWNGCVAVNYDFTMSYQLNSYNYCMAQQEGSFANGDGFVQIAAGALTLNVDHSDFSNNVQDGFDALHLSDDLTTSPAVNISTSIAAHNMGQTFKIGAGSASKAINNIAVGDCRALTVDSNYPLNPSGWSTGNQIVGDACRASGGNWVFALKAGTTLTLQNNTTVGYATTTYNAGCISGTTCITGVPHAVGLFQNNSTYALADPGNSGQFASGWFLPNGDPFAQSGGAASFNNWYQMRTGCPDPLLTTESNFICGNPGLVGVSVNGNSTVVTVDPNITSSSLIYHAGTTIGGITSSYNGVARPPFSMGAFEPLTIAAPTHLTIGTKHTIGTTTMQ